MQKNPIITSPEILEPKNNKGKKNKRQTLCVDKRRSHENCGICGSGDLAFEQLVWCKKCGTEVFVIGITLRWRIDKQEFPCSCKGDLSHLYRGKSFYEQIHFDITNRVCLSCGSVEATTCPACHNNKVQWPSFDKCWTSPTGEKFCRNCGYRFEGYGK